MTITQRTRPCPRPGHPQDKDGPEGAIRESATSRIAAWVRHAPAERGPALAVPAVWTAAEIMHAVHLNGAYGASGAVALTALAYGAGERRNRDAKHPRLKGAEVAAVTGLTTGWAALAAKIGPLAGPDHLMTLGWLLATGGGYLWLRKHEAVKAARARRDAEAAWVAKKTWWHQTAARIGMQGWNLEKLEETKLGEALLVTASPDGKTARQVLAESEQKCERLAHILGLPRGRIDMESPNPGEIRIGLRTTNPWTGPVMHPLLGGESAYAKYVPYPATIKEPLCIGTDPESGDPLTVRLWDKEGAKVVQITAKKGGGKTTLMDTLTERITACPDAVLIQINLSKALEDGWWSPLAVLNALDNDMGRALRTLAFINDLIRERPRGGRRTRVHQPCPAEPLYVLKIDEIDSLAVNQNAKAILKKIFSKCRSEGVAVITAGQRATVDWVGGADQRANADIAIWGKFARSGEKNFVAGADVNLPDMGEYGDRNSGVFGVTDLPADGEYQKGRTFYWGEEADGLHAIVAERRVTRPEHVLEPGLTALAGQWEKLTGRQPASYEPSGREYSDDVDDEFDVEMTPDGESVEGTAGLKAKVGSIPGLLAEADDLIAGAPEVDAELVAETVRMRQQQAMKNSDWQVPPERAMKLMALLGTSPMSAPQAADALDISTRTALRDLSALRAQGLVVLDGSGRGARFRVGREAEGEPRRLRLVQAQG